MDDAPDRFWFDYVDPVSFLTELRLRRGEARVGRRLERWGWEISPPPTALVDPGDPAWTGRWEEAARAAAREGVDLVRPGLVPWTRKAHELALHARERGTFDGVHEALFLAYQRDGRDLGRIDVLVDIAEACGLDPGEVRTVLGVDRHLPEILSRRQRAEREGLRGVPTLAREGRRLEGLVDEEIIEDFLAD